MKAYYYFLFRVYWFYRSISKDIHERALRSTLYISTLVLYFSSIAIFDFFQEDSSPSFLSNYKLKIVLIILIIYTINYYLFIKPMRFLNQNFSKDKKGGFLIILFIIALVFLLIIEANKNRDKISKTYDKTKTENNE